MSPFALDIIVRASALLAAAALADLVLRRPASAATRHLVWTLAIGALLALPIASSVLPEWTVPVPLAQPFSPFDGAQGRRQTRHVRQRGRARRRRIRFAAPAVFEAGHRRCMRPHVRCHHCRGRNGRAGDARR